MKIIETDTKTWKQEAPHTTIHVAFHESPWGPCLVATIEDALAMLIFWNSSQKTESATIQYLKKYWGNDPTIVYSQTKTKKAAQITFRSVTEKKAPSTNLLFKGTPFQRSVWKALLQIPLGQSVQYQDIAKSVKRPKAIRAAGTAVGKNPISLYAPCHRVLPAAGGVGGYAWGIHIKKALLEVEKISYN